MTEQRPSDIVYDAGALPPDAHGVEALARLQLEARRRGETARVCGASGELRELLAFCGLSFVLGVERGLGVEVQRQPEEREDGRGVEEERHLGDLPA
jgi:hypothetical protein